MLSRIKVWAMLTNPIWYVGLAAVAGVSLLAVR